MGLHTRRVSIPGLLMISAASAAFAIAPPPQSNPEPPVFKAGVTLVAVPVYVIDKAGKSVAGPHEGGLRGRGRREEGSHRRVPCSRRRR